MTILARRGTVHRSARPFHVKDADGQIPRWQALQASLAILRRNFSNSNHTDGNGCI
jgi:hypothetical protein